MNLVHARECESTEAEIMHCCAEATVPVRHCRRLAMRTTYFGAFQDLNKMKGEKESTEMKSEDECSPCEFSKPAPWMHFLGLRSKLVYLLSI